MARRGKFGRLPQASPSLTSTLIAIAREMQSQEDQNIMDAWKNGGDYKGQPVTDDMVLAHWRQRLAGVSKDDPLHDAYSNAVLQYEYAIAESKKTLLYKQGKISETEMANFYISWSKKVPKNSEFYRTLQRDGAQFLRAATNKSKSDKAAADEKKYQDDQLATYNAQERAGEYLTSVLTKMAVSNGLIPPGSDIRSFENGDPGKMMQLLSMLNVPGAGYTGSVTGSTNLYEDPPGSGKYVTANDVINTLTQYDPNFTGKVTQSYVSTALRNQINGQQERIDRATSTGHATDVSKLTQWQEASSEVGRQVGAWPVSVSYMDARKAWLSTWYDPRKTPAEKLAAWDVYSAKLSQLASTPGLDGPTVSRLRAEISGDGSVDSMGESFSGLSQSDHMTDAGTYQGDIASTHAALDQYNAMVTLASDPTSGYVWATGEYDQYNNFTPKPGGSSIGAASAGSVMAAGGTEQPVKVTVKQSNGQSIDVYVSGTPVTTKMQNADGESVGVYAIGGSASNKVATAYDVMIGSVKTRVYAFTAADGMTYYTTDTPWDEKYVKTSDTPAGIVLDMSGFAITSREVIDPKTGKQVVDQNGVKQWSYYAADGTQISKDALKAALGDGSNGLALAADGSVIYNPFTFTYKAASDPARAAAGTDPSVDSVSPTIAAFLSLPNGQTLLKSVWSDPKFQSDIDAELHRQAGYTQTDTGEWTGGNEETLKRLRGAVEFQIDPLGLSSDMPSVGGFDRSSTAGTFATSPVSPAGAGMSQRSMLPQSVRFGYEGQSLPSDAVRNTQFNALSSAFLPTTSNLVFGQKEQPTSKPEIKLTGRLKLPEWKIESASPMSYTPPTASTGTTPNTSSPFEAQLPGTAPTSSTLIKPGSKVVPI